MAHRLLKSGVAFFVRSSALKQQRRGPASNSAGLLNAITFSHDCSVNHNTYLLAQVFGGLRAPL